MKHLLIILAFPLIIFGQNDPDTAKVTRLDTTKVTVIDTLLNSHHRNFIDKDGDGFNDLAPDHDGDGIPNGLDKDWRRGKGRGHGFQHRFRHGRKQNIIDTVSIADTAKSARRNKK